MLENRSTPSARACASHCSSLSTVSSWSGGSILKSGEQTTCAVCAVSSEHSRFVLSTVQKLLHFSENPACSNQSLEQERQIEDHDRLVSAYDHQIPRSNPREPYTLHGRDAQVVRRELVGVLLPFDDSPLLLDVLALPLLHTDLYTKTQKPGGEYLQKL